ncbi:hypothetical protein ID866_5408 [Astraeus odoratus]|nr:hypothetical protein ID866_5408 [Astraeus odoratus]
MPDLPQRRSTFSLDLASSPSLAGPFSAPSSTNWRRQRLLQIGCDDVNKGNAAGTSASEQDPTPHELTALHATNSNNYGTLPSIGARASTLFLRRTHTHPSTIEVRQSPSSPTISQASFSPTPLRRTFRRRISQRPISAYDAPLGNPNSAGQETDINIRINGFRVWYSSFSSIDWLHDTIKDSVRFSRLRRVKSLRSRIRLSFDKCLGWIIVTIVGFFTAIVAFVVVRSEQWFFDSKYGYCTDGWWKSQHFCCPALDDFQMPTVGDSSCPQWRRWSELIRSWTHNQPSSTFESDYIEYSTYTCVAILLATLSSLLTIYLTASTSFLTRKDSGVLSPLFATDGKSVPSIASPPKRQVLYYAAGSGIPEIKTILSGFVIHGYLGARTLFTKSLGLALSVGSGLSLGKEGPFVHIASCIGNIVSRCHNKYENNEGFTKRREILSAACAAGVAVAFGDVRQGIVIRIVIRIVDVPSRLQDWHASDLIFFIILGALGGVYGAYFSKMNYRWSRDVRNRTWLKDHPILEVILVTLITAIFCFLNPYTRMGGTELVYNLFTECKAGSKNKHFGLCVQDPGNLEHVLPIVQAIFMTMVMKSALTVVTFGIKLPAGIFIPTLGWNHPENALFSGCGNDKDCVIPGLYAMVGAAAALSGVTRTTVSLAVIMFELTDTLTYAVPVMLSVLVAKTVADALEPKGIYDLVIELSQLPYLDAKHEYLWADFSISDVTNRDAITIRLERLNTVKSLRDQLQSLLDAGHDDSGFPILRTNGVGGMRMVGYIGASELEHALAIVADEPDEKVHFETTYSRTGRDMTASFSSWNDNSFQPGEDPLDFSVYMDEAPLTIQSNSPLPLVHQFFVKLGARYVIVTNTDGDYPYELERLAEELEAREVAKNSTRDEEHVERPELPVYVPLSHDNEYLSADTFDVEQFLLSRAHTSLPDLRTELRDYLSSLKEELVQLINDDYEDFISLSTDLRGEGARLEKIKAPLNALRQQIIVTRKSLRDIQDAVQAKLNERAKLREEKALLHLLLKISESIARLESLLLIPQTGDTPNQPEIFTSHIAGDTGHSSTVKTQGSRGKHLSRVATEYMQLLYHISKAEAEKCAYVGAIQERVDCIRTTLTSDLDHLFSATLLAVTDIGDGKVSELEKAKAFSELTECLRVYDTLGLWRAAEEIIRKNVVQPFVRKTIFHGALEVPSSPVAPSTPIPSATSMSSVVHVPFTPYTPYMAFPVRRPTDGSLSILFPDESDDALAKLYNQVLRFIERNLIRIVDIAERVSLKTGARVMGPDSTPVSTHEELEPLPAQTFEIVANVVWPEVGEAIMNELGSVIFAAGKPDGFLKRHTATQSFIRALEFIAPTTQSVQAMRSHPVSTAFNRRWQLPVYFQLRWKEIVSRLEECLSVTAISSSRDPSDSGRSIFLTAQADLVWTSISSCWSADIFIPDLAARLWKLTLQPGHEASAETNAADDILLKQYAIVLVDIKAMNTQVLNLWREQICSVLPEPTAVDDVDASPIGMATMLHAQLFLTPVRYIQYLTTMKKTEESLRRLKKGKKSTFGIFQSSSSSKDDDRDDDRIRAQMTLDIDALGQEARSLNIDVQHVESYAQLVQMVQTDFGDGKSLLR